MSEEFGEKENGANGIENTGCPILEVWNKKFVEPIASLPLLGQQLTGGANAAVGFSMAVRDARHFQPL